MGDLSSDWPDDADGGVFERLHAGVIDFSKASSFEAWSPDKAVLNLLKSMFGAIKVYKPDEPVDGYIQIQIAASVTYERVTTVQRNVSAAMQL